MRSRKCTLPTPRRYPFLQRSFECCRDRPAPSHLPCNLLLRLHLQHCAPSLLHSDNNTTITIWLQTMLLWALFPQKCDNRTSGQHLQFPEPMGTTHKKVIVRKMDRDTVSGYVSAAFVSDGKIEVLNTAGNVVAIELREVKGIYFVREFGDSESLTRKTFTSRPRTEGLWVRLRFRDNEIIEGMMPNDLVQDGSDGFSVIPPDTRTNTQRIFVPRSALAEMTVLAVIGEKKSQRRGRHPDDTRQVSMFT